MASVSDRLLYHKEQIPQCHGQGSKLKPGKWLLFIDFLKLLS